MNLKPIAILFFLLSFVANNSSAQIDGDVYRQSITPEVKGYNGIEKKSAWCGGVNTPQVAMGDLNNDGIEDVVIYEDPHNLIKTFIGLGGNKYRYDNYYEQFFPKNIKFFFKLIDYNRDNVPDIMSSGLTSSVALYRGYYDNGVLKFKFYKDLRYDDPNSNGTIDVYSPPYSIPGVEDIDNDQDIDLISFVVYPPGFLAFYRNCEKEDGLVPDSVKVCLKDQCWSGVVHIDHVKAYGLNQGCIGFPGTCKTSKTTGGSSNLTLLDYDGDGDMDFMSGHSEYNDIQLLINGKVELGASKDTIISQDTSWTPNGHKVKLDIFPTAFWLDIDQDNDKDIIITPQYEGAENYRCIQFIENIGSSSNPNYQYRSDTFLVEDMIDVGKASYPVFYDYDKDGKKDLFIGSDGYYEGTGVFKSRVSYYRNTSSGGKVSFELLTEDFLGLSSQNFVGTSLAFGDLDNDTLDDMVIGRSDGTFAFFKNNATSSTAQPVWSLKHTLIEDIYLTGLDVGDFAAPFIYDIDNDGKNDLVSGNLLGDLYYYKNVSTVKGSLALDMITKNLGGIKLEKSTAPGGFTVPYIGTVDDTKQDYLVLGTYWGQIYRYDSITTGNITSLPLLDSNYSYIDVGARAAVTFANLDNDAASLHEMVIGNQLGGISYYKQDFPVSVDNKLANRAEVIVYPNPAKNTLFIKWSNRVESGNVTAKLISLTGQEISQTTYDNKETSGEISLKGLSSGMYYCVITINGTKTVHPVTVIK